MGIPEKTFVQCFSIRLIYTYICEHANERERLRSWLVVGK
jgi:hypothetical protein